MIEKPNITISIYTDGACKGNGKSDALGGWGVYSQEMGIELCGGEKATTNNRMELTGAIEALRYISDHRVISDMCSNNTYIIYCDSAYVIKGVTEWMDGWIRKDWINVKNTDLWKELKELLTKIKSNIEWKWVKGHADSVGNNKADELANKGAEGISMQAEDINHYIPKKDFINHMQSNVITSTIGNQSIEVIEKMYDYFESGKYSIKKNNYIDSAYLIFVTMSMMYNKGDKNGS